MDGLAAIRRDLCAAMRLTLASHATMGVYDAAAWGMRV